jgi:hypothetical protein
MQHTPDGCLTKVAEEILRKLCYPPSALVYKPMQEYLSEGHTKQVAELKYHHNERKRKQRLKEVCDLLKQPAKKTQQKAADFEYQENKRLAKQIYEQEVSERVKKNKQLFEASLERKRAEVRNSLDKASNKTDLAKRQ